MANTVFQFGFMCQLSTYTVEGNIFLSSKFNTYGICDAAENSYNHAIMHAAVHNDDLFLFEGAPNICQEGSDNSKLNLFGCHKIFIFLRESLHR
jgi:hypothetical protein